MTDDLTPVLSRYAEVCAASDMGTRPVVWGVHYDSSANELGHLGVPLARGDGIARSIQGVLGPFVGSGQVASSVCVIDSQATPGEIRSVFASRLTAMDGGIMTAHWVVPYEMGDRGNLVFGETRHATAIPAPILAAVSTVMTNRMTQGINMFFDEAVRASVVFLRLLDMADGRSINQHPGESGGEDQQ